MTLGEAFIIVASPAAVISKSARWDIKLARTPIAPGDRRVSRR